MKRSFKLAWLALCLTAVVGCGGNGQESSFVIAPNGAHIDAGDDIELAAFETINPSGFESVEWDSDDGDITVLSSNSVRFKPDGVGVAHITATSNTGKTATAKVYVDN